jgi:hypothetical protein
MLQSRLRFIPEPQAQERYLQGAVAEVLRQAHGRIKRILEQADLFKSITGQDWLYKVRAAVGAVCIAVWAWCGVGCRAFCGAGL